MHNTYSTIVLLLASSSETLEYYQKLVLPFTVEEKNAI